MMLVKVAESFYQECKKRGTDKELLFNKGGRPCVLIVKLKYKGQNHKFVVPLRSNIASITPKEQYFPLPPNSATKAGKRHGVHYIKLFPIDDKYIQKYRIENNVYMQNIKSILDKSKKDIITACQKYLYEYEQGNKNPMTPDIDGILEWL